MKTFNKKFFCIHELQNMPSILTQKFINYETTTKKSMEMFV